MARELSPTEVRTGKVRFSYPHLFEPKAAPGSTALKYSVSLIIDKTDTSTLKAIKAAINEAIKIGVEKKWGGKQPPKLKLPVGDGDRDRPDDPAYAGKFFLNANSDRKPGIVDNSTPPIAITDPEELYAGSHGRAFINFFAFDKAGNKGIGVGLQHVQKLEEGERLSGRVSVGEAFEDWGGAPTDDLGF